MGQLKEGCSSLAITLYPIAIGLEISSITLKSGVPCLKIYAK
jgi:hypothetical protein